MTDQAGLRAPNGEGPAERRQRQVTVQAVTDGPTDDAPGEQVHDNGQVKPGLASKKWRDVGLVSRHFFEHDGALEV